MCPTLYTVVLFCIQVKNVIRHDLFNIVACFIQGHHTSQSSIETVGKGFRRKDQEKSRRRPWGRTTRVQEGERNSRRDLRPEIDSREETGGTGQYGSGVRRHRESF